MAGLSRYNISGEEIELSKGVLKNKLNPFREGNGRTIRLFLDLLVLQSGYSFIDYKKSSQPTYIKACIAGMKKDYAPIIKIMYRGLVKKT